MCRSIDQPRKELSPFCVDMSNGELLPRRTESLEALMLDHPQVQEEYCLQVLLDLLLQDEFGGSHDVRPLLEWDGDRIGTESQKASESVVPVTHQQSSTSRRWVRLVLAGTVAAVVAIIAIGAFDRQILTLYRLDTVKTSTSPLASERMELRNADVTRMLYRVTNTSWDSAAVPSSETHDVTTSLGQGIADLGEFNESYAGGYIVELPPGAALNLTVHADAAGENALSVIGLDKQGQTTGEIVSFSNQANSITAQDSTTVYGQIGIWSELNDSPNAKFYLLTGLHHAATTSGEMRWQVTDFRAFFETPRLLHIGWDDTDWTPKTAGIFPPDKDYDDVTVTVRIVHVNEGCGSDNGKVRTYPARDQEHVQLQTLSIESEYPFSVLPGEGVVLTVSSKAGYESELVVIGRHARHVWWRRCNRDSTGSHLGVFVVENFSTDTLELSLVGRHKLSDANEGNKWRASSYRRRLDHDLSRRDRCQMIAFEDFGGDDEDYNDIRVNMHWINL